MLDRARALLAAATPAPWTLDTGLGLFSATIRAAAAPPAVDVREHTLAAQLDRAVFHAHKAADAEAIVAAVNALSAFSPTSAEWERLRRLWDGFACEGALVGDVILDGELFVDRSHVAAEDGARAVHVNYRTPKGRLARRRLGICTMGDGSDPLHNAELIAALPTLVPWFLAETSEGLHFSTAIDGKTVVVDTTDRALVESPACAWTIQAGEIVDRKTGQRMADAIMGVDGTAYRAHPKPPALAADFDLRRCNVTVADRRVGFRVELAAEEIAALESKAKAAGQDVGRWIAEALK